MNCVYTTILGFYSGKHHPDATHFPALQHNLNDQIKTYLQHNEDLVKQCIAVDRELKHWDGNNIPNVTVKQVKPKWTPSKRKSPQRWATRATGLSSPHRFRYLLRKIVSEVEWDPASKKHHS